jgi:hypothetical protein
MSERCPTSAGHQGLPSANPGIRLKPDTDTTATAS